MEIMEVIQQERNNSSVHLGFRSTGPDPEFEVLHPLRSYGVLKEAYDLIIDLWLGDSMHEDGVNSHAIGLFLDHSKRSAVKLITVIKPSCLVLRPSF